MGADNDGKGSRRHGQRLGLLIAGTALAYMLIQLLGSHYGWSMRTMGLFDLAAMAVFGWALVSAFLTWRSRQDDS